MIGRMGAFRFDTFVAGPSARLAVAAGRAMAEARHPPYNPLLLCGGPGLGKTHLLGAIAALAVDIDPSRVVRTIALEDWDGMAPRSEPGDLLLIDDLEAIGPDPDRQAVLADLLAQRMAAGHATVLTADRLPTEIDGLDPRLARWATSGLVTEVGFPALDQRWEIVTRLAAGAEPPIRGDVLAALAALPVESVRELVGAVRRLTTFQEVSQGPLEVSQAMVLLTGIVPAVVFGSPAPMAHAEGITADAPDAPGAQEPKVDGAPTGGEPGGGDEFGDFLSDVAAAVSDQVDRWRSRVGDGILRWESEGFRTARLEALLAEEFPVEPEQALARYEADVARLQAIAREIHEIAPGRAADPALRDPDALGAAETLLEESRLEGTSLPAPRSDHRLEDLAEGPSTRRAIQAARTAAAEPGRRYNPLVIVGPSGSGKTHLVHGIAAALDASGIRLVACLEASQVLREGEAEIGRRYRHVGALLLDGLDAAAGDRVGQGALVGVIDALRAAGRQMVFTFSRAPAELEGMDPRLRTRLDAGLAVELGPPDREVRLQVVKRMLAGTAAGADAALIDFLAGRPADSVRAVQGMVHRVRSAAEAQGTLPSQALAREVLDAVALRGNAKGPRSGIVSPLLAGTRAKEKLVVRWPAIEDRLLEDLR